MIEIKAPNEIPFVDAPKLFLAGSIEMGVAEKWQDRVVKALANTSYVILNPRRDDWDSSWEQKIDNPKFNEQVMWELSSMDYADKILMYFSPGTQSPITLLELGLQAVDPYRVMDKLLVVCPEGFWRKGNVDIVCREYGIDTALTLEEAIHQLVMWENENA